MMPFIILIIILLFIVVMVYLSGKINLSQKGYWLIGAYAVLLLLSAILYFFIPKEQFHAVEALLNKDNRVEIVHHVAYGDRSIDDFEKYAVKEWTIETAMDEILYFNIDSHDFFIPILIKEVSDSPALNATLYQVKSEFEGFDEGNKMVELSYFSDNDELLIVTPEGRYFEYASIAKEFPFTQLSATDAEEYEYFRPDFYSEELVIYLEVPEELEITFDYDIYHEYID